MRSKIHKLFIFAFVTAAFGLGQTASAQGTGEGSLGGTYNLDTAASEDSREVLEYVVRGRNLSASEKADLERKLKAPESVTITVRGSEVSVSTSGAAAPAVIRADGVGRSSVTANGDPVSVKAELNGGVLTISSLGSGSDYTLIFKPLDGGQSMKVTRRITTSYLSETVFTDSLYRREGGFASTTDSGGGYDEDNERGDDDAGYSDSGSGVVFNPSPDSSAGRRSPDSPRRRPARMGNFVIPTGTIVTGSLNTLVTTRASQENDRFSLTVQSPARYSGAVIEGYLSDVERTGKIAGRSRVTFNFETITLNNGRRFDFAGVLQAITDENGRAIKINSEGEARSRSRTRETAKRSGIGAGLGAIIGGLLGGGKGALIGATIGAGAGAGSMIPGKRDELEIPEGSRFTIQATGNGR